MITKKEFVNIMNRLRDYNDLQDKIQDLFKENIDNQEMDFMNAGSICIGHETVVVHLLENMFNDKDTITWRLYEGNYGRADGNVIWEDEKEIHLNTPEKLYDYLIKNM